VWWSVLSARKLFTPSREGETLIALGSFQSYFLALKVPGYLFNRFGRWLGAVAAVSSSSGLSHSVQGPDLRVIG